MESFPPKRRATVSKPVCAIGVFFRSFAVFLLALLSMLFVSRAYDVGSDDLRNAILAIMTVVLCYGLAVAFLATCHLAIESSKAKKLLHQCEHEEIGSLLRENEGRAGCLLFVLRGIYQKFQTNREIESNVLFEAMHSRLSEPLSRMETCADVNAQCGLIGTVAGLMMMLGGIPEAVAESSVVGGPSIMESMFMAGGPLSALGTAFVTTLYGAVSFVLLGSLAAVHDQSVRRFVVSCKEDIDVYVEPDFRKSVDDEEVEGDE